MLYINYLKELKEATKKSNARASPGTQAQPPVCTPDLEELASLPIL